MTRIKQILHRSISIRNISVIRVQKKLNRIDAAQESIYAKALMDKCDATKAK